MKVKDDAALKLKMNDCLRDLKAIIEEMSSKRGSLFLSWVEDQCKYLQYEEKFDPMYLKKYKRGELVLVQFGFNVGSEHGGLHWAVIMDDNHKSNPNALVVPLGSLNQGEDRRSIHRNEVFLGKITSINNRFVYAIPHQVRVISKLRIYKPKKARQKTHFLSPHQMELIEHKLFSALFPSRVKDFDLTAASAEVDNDPK